MNNRTRSRITIISASLSILLISFAGLSASAAGLGNTKQFTVEMKMSTTSGPSAGESMTMKYFVGENRLRMEMMMDGGQEGGIHISLHDGDQVTSYMLIPQMKMYMKNVGGEGGMMGEEEGPTLMFGSPDDADHPCKSDPDVTCKKIGSDTFIGRAVDKYLVTDLEDGTPSESTIWFDRELLFPVKIEDSEGIMEAVSIEEGKQPDELFEIPAGYREMSM
jgi:outer membrane lipoprotein-sorting protein